MVALILAMSVVLALRTARREARSGGSSTLEPVHLLMGLGKLCRTDLGEDLGRGRLDPRDRPAVEEDAERLRWRFGLAGVDPDVLRHRLRSALLVEPRSEAAGTRKLRSSQAAATALTRAGELAGEDLVRAGDLLYAALESPGCRAVFRTFGIDEPLTAF